MARFKDIEAQLNGQRIPTVQEAGQAYKDQVTKDEEKLKALVTNPLGAIKQMAEPVPMPTAKSMMKFSPEEQAKNSDAWQKMTESRPAPVNAELAEKIAYEEESMNELRANAQASEAMPKQKPNDLLKDPRVFEMIKRQLGAK